MGAAGRGLLPGVLMYLRFIPKAPDSTVQFPLLFKSWNFEAGCLRPKLTDGMKNDGMQPVQFPRAQLVLPAEAHFSGPNPQTGVIRQITGSLFNPGDSDTAQWAVDVDVQTSPRAINFRIDAFSTIDTVRSSCFTGFLLPRTVPVLHCRTFARHGHRASHMRHFCARPYHQQRENSVAESCDDYVFGGQSLWLRR